MADERRIRLAVVGAGFGAAVHVPVFQSLPSVEVAALIGHRPDKTAQLAWQHGIRCWHTGYEALGQLDVDAVSIALPPDVSGAAVRLAQRRGLHIFAEKPVALAGRELADIVHCPTDRVQMVNYSFPDLPAFQHLRQLVQTEAHGRVRLVNVQWLVHSHAERTGLHNWKRDRVRGGGVLHLLGTHLLYNLEWLFGRIRTVRAVVHPHEPTAAGFHPAAHTVSLVLDMAAGFVATAVLSNAAPFSSLHQIEVICDRATIRLANTGADYVREFANMIHSADGVETRTFRECSSTADSRFAACERLMRRFIAAIQNPEERPSAKPDFVDEGRVHQLVAAIRPSLWPPAAVPLLAG